MENPVSENLRERQPKLVDLFGPDMEAKLKSEGKVYRRKIEAIRGAEEVTEAHMVETRLPDGTLESSVEAQQGDWVITGAKGEKFVFTAKKFKDLYESNNNDGYIPKERKILAVENPFGESVKISAPWGTQEKSAYQEGGEKCFFVFGLDESGEPTPDRYIIGDNELLLSNYELVEDKQTY